MVHYKPITLEKNKELANRLSTYSARNVPTFTLHRKVLVN